MRKLTATLCLTLAVLLGSAGVSASAENKSIIEKKIGNTELIPVSYTHLTLPTILLV